MRLPATLKPRQSQPCAPSGMAGKLRVIQLALKDVMRRVRKGAKMSIQLEIEEMPGYLAAKFTGVGAPEEIWRQFGLIAEHCKSANKNKLLLNFAEAHTGASLADRYFTGESAVIFARYKLIKVAMAARPEGIDPQRFGEMVMRNRGVNARVFKDAEEAEEWLLK